VRLLARKATLPDPSITHSLSLTRSSRNTSAATSGYIALIGGFDVEIGGIFGLDATQHILSKRSCRLDGTNMKTVSQIVPL